MTGRNWLAFIICLSIVLAVLACGCGSSGPSPDLSGANSDSASRIKAGGDQLLTGQRTKQGRSLGRALCTNAQVKLGSESRAIQFVVKCVGRRGGSHVGFTLGRYSLQGRRSRQGIQRITRRPVLSGNGTRTNSNGSCRRLKRGSWLRDGVYCHARAFGGLTMTGRILVNSDRRCDMGVLVTAAVQLHCDGRVCPAMEQYRTLATGRPQGC